jgi:hypothetical protein
MHMSNLIGGRWWLRGLLAAVLALAFAFKPGLPADAAVISNTNGTITDNIFVNPCNGEILVFNEHFHDSIAVTLNGNGGAFIDFHSEQSGSGSGNLGNQYVVNAVGNTELNFPVGASITFMESEQVVATGSAPNFLLTDVFHLTVNPDGTTTSFRDGFTSSCHG